MPPLYNPLSKALSINESHNSLSNDLNSGFSVLCAFVFVFRHRFEFFGGLLCRGFEKRKSGGDYRSIRSIVLSRQDIYYEWDKVDFYRFSGIYLIFRKKLVFFFGFVYIYLEQ